LPRILICGVGNKLKKDDGLGPYIIEELEKQVLPANVSPVRSKLSTSNGVSLMDFGTSGFKTALEIGKYHKVIFVDAIQLGNQPGQIYKTTLSKQDLLESPSLSSFTISLHEGDLEKILTTATLIGNYPKEVVVLGCEPEDLSFGLGLSRKVEKAVSKIIDLILKEIG